MEENTNYEVLIPNNMIENKAEDALEFALKNEKIRNVAITGQYSSGKSSMIQSYFGKYCKEKEYLNISLATFEKKENANEPIEESNSLERVIIEKLYYSFLKKYDKQENIKESILTGILVAFINIGIYLFNIEAIRNSLNDNFWTTLIFIFLEIICLTSIIGCSISFVMNFQKIKLKLGDVEVEVNHNSKETSRNLLNEEIDFIVKIMSIAKYKYIVFEDLDRFQNPKIFERLRDLNITLNSTLKNKVKFIYAIKDEMFIADNRTKFFDFIIPVVPYVSYENSGEELLKIIRKHGLENELSEDFILDIALYIPDMRILKNTINEYIIYKKTLDKKPPNYEKLFSILLYKNTCSQDFAKLQNKDGEVYKCFSKKSEVIEKYIEEKQEEIEDKKKEHKELEKNLISKNSIKELAVYYMKSISKDYQVTLKSIEGKEVRIQLGMNVENISDNILFSDNTTIEYVYNGSWKTENLSNFFKEKCPGFFEQYEIFREGVDDIKEKISMEIGKINEEIDKIRECTLSELLQENGKIVTVSLGKYSDLIKYLLNNGYIDENYSTYINKFHEGSITENDYNFIMNVRNGKQNNYKDKLDNTIKIIKRLKNAEFKKEEILNIDILDVLIENDLYVEKKNIFFSTLIKSNRYVEFIKYCICESETFKNKNKMITNLCKLDKDILNKVQDSKIENRYKNFILEDIIIKIEIDNLKELNNIDEILKYSEENNLLKKAKIVDIKDKIDQFDIKYNNISEFKDNIDLYKYIVENNKYKINYENILEILMNESKSNKDEIEEENYYSISKNKQLKKYIDEDIEFYIGNVYSKLPKKQKNPIGIVVDLLNNSNMNAESKRKIIIKEINKIEDISEIQDSGLWKVIFDNNLVKLGWKNINNYYEKLGLDETLINIFNDKEKRKLLLQDNIKIEDNSNSEFIRDLLLSNNLNEEAHSLILKNSEYKLSNVEISELKEEKLLKLVNNKRIEFSNEMIEKVRAYSVKMLIAFIKNNYNNFYKEIDNDSIVFNLEEINGILESDVTPNMKNKCINMIRNDEIESLPIVLLENISLVSINNNLKDNISEEILLKIIMNIQNIESKIKLINLNFSKVSRDNIDILLKSLGEDYYKIIVNRTRPSLKHNESNILLLENIKSLGYKIKHETNGQTIKLKNTIR